MGETMSFQDLIKKSVLKMDAFAKISALDIFIGLLMTFLVTILIFYMYRKTFRGVVYSHTYNISLVLMSLITSLIIMTISSNVVLSLGMVGALSIIRFRTAIKDPMDIVFMFWSISVGIASGAGFYAISVLGSIFITLVLVALSKYNFKDASYLLVIHHTSDANDGVKYVLNGIKHTLKSKTINKGKIELTVELKIKGDNTAFLNELSEVEGVQDVVMVSYDGNYAA